MSTIITHKYYVCWHLVKCYGKYNCVYVNKFILVWAAKSAKSPSWKLTKFNINSQGLVTMFPDNGNWK